MKVQQPKTRASSHRALFDQNLPFRGKAERLRTRYSRKAKHRGRDQE